MNDGNSLKLIAEIRKLNENMEKIEAALAAMHDLFLMKGDDWFAK